MKTSNMTMAYRANKRKFGMSTTTTDNGSAAQKYEKAHTAQVIKAEFRTYESI